MMWEEIIAKKGVADSLVREIANNFTQVQDELKKGVSLGTAKVIIKGIWGETSDAKKLVAKLSVNFPKENSYAIQYATLPDYAVTNLIGDASNAADFLLDVHGYIERMVGKVFGQLSGRSLEDELAIQSLNEFRRNTLIYIEGVKYSSFCLDTETTADVTSWQEYTVSSQAVDDGDYLLVTDFLPDLHAAHKDMMERRNKDVFYDGDCHNLYSIGYDAKRYLAELNSSYLFAEYLTNLVSSLEIVLD